MTVLSVETALSIHSSMWRMRAFEDRLGLLYKQGKVSGGVFTGRGNEALCCTAAFFLQAQDALGPTHRDMGAHFAKGIDYLEMARQWLARGTGGTFGKDNAAHLGSLKHHVFGIISPLATMVPLAAGAALAARVRGDEMVSLTFIGDGATSCGDFHEGLALMADLKLPVVVIIENNQYAYSTPSEKQHRREHFADHAECFSLSHQVLDGTDVTTLYPALEMAFNKARSGEGPSVIEGVTWRMSGHSLADNTSYIDPSFYEEGQKNDPVEKIEAWLRGQSVAQEQLDEVRTDWNTRASKAFEQALTEPVPAPETVAEGVFAEAL